MSRDWADNLARRIKGLVLTSGPTEAELAAIIRAAAPQAAATTKHAELMREAAELLAERNRLEGCQACDSISCEHWQNSEDGKMFHRLRAAAEGGGG